MDVVARNARAEAQQLVGDAFEAAVLEPSPPAVADGTWFADDPFRPVPSWPAWLAEHPEHEAWAARCWLGGPCRLPPVPSPAVLAETRLALHRLAVYVVSPARRRVNGKIALRWTLDGFGTPFFGDDEQVRVAGTTVVRQRGDQAEAAPITTLAGAARFVLDGPPDVEWAASFDVPEVGDVDQPLAVDAAAATFLGAWYGLAASALETLRAEPASTDPSRVQLWPEHFDLAFDCHPGGRRATFGLSPGDAAVPQPYAYVLPPEAEPGEVWNATTFSGAILTLDEIPADADPREAVVRFFRSRRDHLLGRSS